MKQEFRNQLGANVFRGKYAISQAQSWHEKARHIVEDVCGYGIENKYNAPLMSTSDRDQLVKYISEFKFLPGGRYIYYAGRKARFYNNCYLLRAEEDTREEWANVMHRSTSCLMTGGGIGCDYSLLRPKGRMLSRTGGISSGAIPLMRSVNEIGRNVMQGGSRRSAIYASLNWQHEDAADFLTEKNWSDKGIGKSVDPDSLKPYTYSDYKNDDFNAPASLDMTNISLNWDDAWLNMTDRHKHPIFLQNVMQAMFNGEPGFSFNFGNKQNETLRNAPVSGNTRVLTPLGYQSVKDIVGQDVIVWTGKRWAQTVFNKTKDNVQTITVTLSNGRSITCDREHPFIVWNKSSGEHRVAAEELVSGMSIACDLPKDSQVSYYFGSPDEYGYGYVFGDGSIVNHRGDISVHTDTKLEAYEYACEVLGANKNASGSRAYFKSRTKSKLFSPSLNFVAGWFDADGCYSRNMLRLSSTDIDSLISLSEFLDIVGIKTTISKQCGSGYNKDGVYFSLCVIRDSHNRFAEIVPTRRVKPNAVVKTRKFNIKVVDVVSSGITEDVYCCDVGVEEHSFMAEGVLISNCTEVTSEDDSDVCNLGSVNLAACENIAEFTDVVRLAAKFLVCGTIRAELPYEKVYKVREKNRRLGLGLMGIHEWLLRRNYRYEVTPELHTWLAVYASESEAAANEHCDRFYINRPKAYRAIAPTGTIGILAGTTTGIEPIYAVAYKRRYLTEGTKWKYEFAVDSTAQLLIESGISPDAIETAVDLSKDPERRIKFQADVQDYVDMAISSTLNLPTWGSAGNNVDKVEQFAEVVSKYAPRLRGLTFYPDGSRGGQPINAIPYDEAMRHKGVVFEENSSCKDGVCGL